MTNIYDQHDKAFRNVSSYVLIKDNKKIASISFKYPKDGAGRVSCYLHVIGTPMVKGVVNGYGYDKASAAIMNAVTKLYINLTDKDAKKYNNVCQNLQHLLKDADSKGWDRCFYNSPYELIQAI